MAILLYNYACFQPSAKQQRTVLLWVITQRVVVIYYRHFGTTCLSHPEASRSLLGFVPKTSERNYHYSLHNNPEERSAQSVQLFLCYMILLRGTAVAQWLRCCDTNRKDAGSIQAGVSGFFIDIKPFRSHYGPGVDSASNRNEYQKHFLGVKSAGTYGWQPTTILCRCHEIWEP